MPDSNIDQSRNDLTPFTSQHNVISADDQVTRCDQLHHSSALELTPELLLKIALEIWDEEKVQRIPSSAFQDLFVQQMLLTIRAECINSPDECALLTKSIADTLTLYLQKYYPTRSHQSPDEKGGLTQARLKMTLEYINNNLEIPITLQDLTDLTGLGQYHFSRAFKKSTGLSPYQYIIRQRIEFAKTHLTQGGMSLSEIALICGFTHQSHFHRHFKRLTGITPRQFRLSQQ